MSLHTVSVLVQDRPGVLARVAGLFARRGFNIHSLAVGNTEDQGMSRMTIVVDVKSKPLEQVTKQLNKLVHVVRVTELEAGSAVERELVLIKVRATNGDRARVIEIAQIFRARILDVAHEALTIEATGPADKIEALAELLRPFGVVEMARTGTIALSRGQDSLKDRRLRSVKARTA
ncbi:MAG: acetolactate synthase small subunit [Actinobacteria bacterium]|nr:acetolactate synthase small subunit [Actinomycetota bacterium]